MKFINAPASVDVHNGVPRQIRWARRTYRVRRLLDYWILQSRWWSREEKRVYFRLETDRGVVEVYRVEAGAGDEERDEKQQRKKEKGGKGERGEKAWSSGRAARERDTGTSGPTTAAHPPFVEGDTHTRELRQTESPYRPDAADLVGRRARTSPAARTARPPRRPPRWVLSRIAD